MAGCKANPVTYRGRLIHGHTSHAGASCIMPFRSKPSWIAHALGPVSDRSRSRWLFGIATLGWRWRSSPGPTFPRSTRSPGLPAACSARAYTADGHPIGEFGEERRDVCSHRGGSSHPRARHPRRRRTSASTNTAASTCSAWLLRRTANPSSGAAPGGPTITMQVAQFLPFPEKQTCKLLRDPALAFREDRAEPRQRPDPRALHQPDLPRPARLRFAAAARAYYGTRHSEQLIPCPKRRCFAGSQGPPAFNPIRTPARAAVRQHVLRRMLGSRLHRRRPASACARLRHPAPEPARHRRARRVQDIVVPGDRRRWRWRARSRSNSSASRPTSSASASSPLVTRSDQEAAYASQGRGVLDYDRRHGWSRPRIVRRAASGQVPDEQLDEALRRDQRPRRPACRTGAQGQPEEGGASSPPRLVGDPHHRQGPVLRRPDVSGTRPASRRVRRGAIIRVRNTGKDGWDRTVAGSAGRAGGDRPGMAAVQRADRRLRLPPQQVQPCDPGGCANRDRASPFISLGRA